MHASLMDAQGGIWSGGLRWQGRMPATYVSAGYGCERGAQRVAGPPKEGTLLAGV